MNRILKSLADGASDVNSFARSLAESGLRSVSEVFRGTKIYGALSASTVSNVEYDETHYVLVPLLGEERSYAIYTKRILPPDTGAINPLPKARVFHVPDEAGRGRIEQELIANLVGTRLSGDAGASEIADALQKLADQIDQETSKISGGVILIGGAIAFLNPLLGMGIAAKGLLPIIGAKASKLGAEYVGKKLRAWNQSAAESKLRKVASKEVLLLKPRVYANPIIRSLEQIAGNPKTDYDPFFDRHNWVDGFESPHLFLLTQEAVREVYRDLLGTAEFGMYQKSHITWIRTMIDTP